MLKAYIIFLYINFRRHFLLLCASLTRRKTVLEQLALTCKMSGLGTILSMKFTQNVRDVIFPRPFSQNKLLSDLAVAGSLGEQFKYLDLPWTQHLFLYRARRHR